MTFSNNTTGEVTDYLWDYGDNITGTTSAVTHTHVYTTTGVYTVSLTASGPGGTDTLTRTGYITATEAAPEQELTWWDDDLFYRLPLTVAVGQPLGYTPGVTIPLGLTLDTATLVGDGKLRGDDHDLRVAYWDGAAWEELPRAVQGMGSPTSTVIFPLQATITNTDKGYYLYYGNAIAGEPPLLLTDTVIAGVTVTPGPEETATVAENIDAALGGELLSTDGRTRVTFSPGAVAETVLASHTPYRAVYPQPKETLARFDLEAETLGGQPVTAFSQPVTLTFDYSSLAVPPTVEDTMTLYRWDEGLQEWQAISSTVDTEARRLTAVLDHFSGYAIATAQAERQGAVPAPPATVAGFQTDLFTGASTFVYPIQVAPGTAGMQPELSLSYSSLAADQGWKAQAGWVGFGFNLDASYIARDANGIPDDLDDDTFHLVLNGVSSALVQDGPDSFLTEQETFWRIRRHTGGYSGADGGQYWVVTDTNGTEYRFGYNTDAAWNSLTWVPGVGYEPHTYRYNLDRVRDVHGNYMIFEYEKEQEWLNDPPYALQYDRAGYLQRIRYTGNDLTGLAPQREVVFEIQDREVATYPDIYAWGPLLSIQHFFFTKQLAAIEVRVDGQRVRRYDFDYHHENGWGEAYVAQCLLLDGITQLGSQGDTPLITTTFTYYDDQLETSTWQRLKEGRNSYGAWVRYEYDSIELEDGVRRVRVVQRTVGDGQTEHVYGYGYGTPRVVGDEFRGHDWVVVTLPNDEFSMFHFNQGLAEEPLKGRLERVEKYDGQGTWQSTQENIWQYEPGGGGAHFVYLAETVTTIGPSPSLHVSYLYDAYGNLIQLYEPGDPNTTTDDRYRVLAYTVNTDVWIVNRPKSEEVRNYTQSPVARTEYYYDHHTTLDQPPQKGDLTRLVQVDLVGGNDLVTEYDHDAYGNVTQVTDGRGHTTVTTYDSTYHTFPETVTYPLPGFVTTAHYDARFGLPEWATDLNGQTTHYEYDLYGRLRQVWAPLDYGSGTPTVEYVYSATPSGLEVQTRRKEAYGAASTYDSTAFYNGLGQLVRTTAEGEGGATIRVDYQYDGLGRQWKVSAPYTDTAQWWTETTYDALGRPDRVTNPDGTYRQYIYSGWERVEVRDENGHYRGYGRDAFGRTVQVDEYTDGYPTTPYATTHYSYDLLGNLTGVEDDLGHSTVITYDSLGRKLVMDDPDMGHWSYTYDADGNLETQTDANGTVITLAYDALDRLVSKSYSNGDPSVTYIYDAGSNGKGRRTGMADASGTTEYTSDVQGRLLTETRTIDGVAYTTGFTYDPMDRVRTMTYPDGEVVTYTYNEQGLLESMAGQDAYVGNLDYNALGQPTRLELGNGLATTYGYHDANFRLESIVTTGGLQNLNYTYDNVGNVQTMVDSVGGLNLTYAYDELDRLTNVSGSYARSYGYDNIGNPTDKNGLTLEYNDPRPHAVSGTSEGWTFDYGPTGNLITKTVGSQVVTFGYDAENRLTQVISDTVTTFVYDGDGQRMKKIDESGTTVYVGEHYEVRYENVPWQELLDGWQFISGPAGSVADLEEFKGNLYRSSICAPFGCISSP
ncbi:MAG: PKD domain-containing protein [Anaerolineae bacterium]|nr:PKD domain-containing protein [Anaerolineae bacterium]